jgi:hypothetical protein
MKSFMRARLTWQIRLSSSCSKVLIRFFLAPPRGLLSKRVKAEQSTEKSIYFIMTRGAYFYGWCEFDPCEEV